MTRPADNPTEATQAQKSAPGPANESLERIAETLTETSMSAGVDVAAQTIADSFDGLDAETLKCAHLAAIGTAGGDPTGYVLPELIRRLDVTEDASFPLCVTKQEYRLSVRSLFTPFGAPDLGEALRTAW
ncbi:hypothetical protein AB0I24_16105 [Brachybacterium paraconglomeratum]